MLYKIVKFAFNFAKYVMKINSEFNNFSLMSSSETEGSHIIILKEF